MCNVFSINKKLIQNGLFVLATILVTVASDTNYNECESLLAECSNHNLSMFYAVAL